MGRGFSTRKNLCLRFYSFYEPRSHQHTREKFAITARWLRTALGWAAFLEAQAALARWTLNGVTCETGRLADALLARTGRRNGVILVVDGIVDHTNYIDTTRFQSLKI